MHLGAQIGTACAGFCVLVGVPVGRGGGGVGAAVAAVAPGLGWGRWVEAKRAAARVRVGCM